MVRVHLPADLLGDARVVVEGDAHKYLARVLRLAAGDQLIVFDGAGTEIDARVVAVGAKSTELSLGERRTIVRSSGEIVLLQGVAKGERMDLVVQKATELGVSRVLPVLAKRSIARPRAGDNRHTRWQAIAREAARQCGRADVPEIAPPVSLEQAIGHVPETIATRFVLWEGCHGLSLRRALEGVGTGVALLVGPEGGLEASEVETAGDAGFVAVGLGPRILRTETAAIVAVALAQAALGGLDP